MRVTSLVLVTQRVERGGGQARVDYEIVHEALRQGWRVCLVASTVAPELVGEVQWRLARVGRWPTQLVKNQVFARASARVLPAVRGPTAVVHVDGCATLSPADVNAAHFVHSAWKEARAASSARRASPLAAYRALYSAVNARLERVAFRRATVVVAVSNRVRDELVSHADVAPDKIRVIPNGVSLDEFHPGVGDRPALGIDRDAFVVIFAGDLRTRRKNLDVVLRALPGLPECHLLVVGDAVRSPYPRLASELGLAKRVHFLGFRPDMPQLMRAADALVFPSHYDPFGLVVTEAMASGLPVIVSRAAGVSQLVEDGRTGLLMPDARDAEALRAAVAWLRAHPDQAGAMGKRARGAVEAFGWSPMAQAYLKVYSETLAARRTSPLVAGVRG